jgi:hypothetical protein
LTGAFARDEDSGGENGGSGGGSGGGGDWIGGGHEHAAVFVCVDGLVIGVGIFVAACVGVFFAAGVVLFVVCVCGHGAETGAGKSEVRGLRIRGVV